jgi:hypothetical protein
MRPFVFTIKILINPGGRSKLPGASLQSLICRNRVQLLLPSNTNPRKWCILTLLVFIEDKLFTDIDDDSFTYKCKCISVFVLYIHMNHPSRVIAKIKHFSEKMIIKKRTIEGQGFANSEQSTSIPLIER